MNELVSIIIPVYNVEEYLPTCVDSVLKQTYKMIEIILVDDGSPDGCGEICDRYAMQDTRIKVIHKENGGLSDARNVGLKAALGKYVLFIDSDDYVSYTMVEQLFLACEETRADIGVCFFDMVKDNSAKLSGEITDVYDVLLGKNVIKKIYYGKGEQIAFTAWNKLYKRSLFFENEIFYPLGKYYEDTCTTYKLMYFANKIAIVDKPLYHYRIRENSIMTSNLNRKKCIDGISADRAVVEFFLSNNEEELYSLAAYYFFKSTIKTYMQAKKINKKEERNFCVRYLYAAYKEMWLKHRSSSGLSISRKLLCGGFAFCPNIISKISMKYL